MATALSPTVLTEPAPVMLTLTPLAAAPPLARDWAKMPVAPRPWVLREPCRPTVTVPPAPLREWLWA